MSIRQLLKDNDLYVYAREFIMAPSIGDAIIISAVTTGFIQTKFNIDYVLNGCVTQFSGKLLYSNKGTATGNMVIVLPTEMKPPPIGESYACVISVSSTTYPYITGVIVNDGFNNPIINLYHITAGIEIPLLIQDLTVSGFVFISGFYFNNVCG